MIDNVINILQEQEKIYQKLIKYSSQMQNAIVKDDVNEINILIQAESALAMKNSVLERKRIKLINTLAKEVSYDGDNFNIDELKKHTNDQQLKKLNEHERNMADVLIELENLNTTNGKMIKNKLDIVNFSLNYLGLANNGVYDKQRKSKGSQSKLIDESI